MNDLQDVVAEFLVESNENLDQLDRDLVTLEGDPTSLSVLSSVFRTIHTIKGTCGFLGFSRLESVAHLGENLLSQLRDGVLRLKPDMTTALLALVDAIREMLDNIASEGTEGEADYAELTHSLREFVSEGEERSRDRVESPAPLDNGRKEGAAPPAGTNGAPAGVERGQRGVFDGGIRVDVGVIDKLINRVGELVLARNQMLRFTSSLHDSALLDVLQRLNLVTTELQEGIMKTRMQPIGNIWSKLPRVVRDLAVQSGKQVRIEMDGKETELDKTIIEAIRDPLTHLVRNAVDHGIESPEARVAAGKPRAGSLFLRAFHEGGQVNLEIRDDGGGLPIERIRQMAVEKGLIRSDQAPRMSDHDVAQLIFTPGFSTADQVTNISGRGVGMDVVKTNVERIGGAIEIVSRPGRGTTVKLKIPLTLAIIPALVVTCDGDRYAIPQVSLRELLRLDPERAREGLVQLHGAAVYRLRGQLLPIVDLRHELGLAAPAPGAGVLDEGKALNIAVLQADDREFGLVVDSINNTEDIVVKPLSKQLKGISVFAGATIMGDGKVALILDVLGIAQRAHIVSEARDRLPTEHRRTECDAAQTRQTLLILELGDRRLALPICQVSRVEKISGADIEQAHHGEVIQYRGEVLPLLRLADVLGVQTKVCPDRPLQLVVYRQGDRSVGLVVDRIADIIDATVEATTCPPIDELFSAAIVQQRVTDLLNLPSLVRRADPTFCGAAPDCKGTLA